MPANILHDIPIDAVSTRELVTQQEHCMKTIGPITLISVVGAFVSLLAGCMTSQVFTPEDFCAKPVNPAMARIVLTRRSQILGAAGRIGIADSGQPIGNIAPGDQLCWDRYPGKALIVASAGRMETQFALDTKAGSTYRVTFSIQFSGFKLQLEGGTNP